MKKFPKIMLITLGFGLATLLTGFLTSRPTTAQHVAPVRVTNTPLPVNGNVTPLLVRNVDEPARQPYRDHCSVSITPAFFQLCTITVPAGEAVVVQTESMEVRANIPGTRFMFDIQTPVNGPNQPAILQDFPDRG